MIQIPAFNGNNSIRSWEPPSGNIQTQSLLFNAVQTCSYINDWSTLGYILKDDFNLASVPFSSHLNSNSVSEITFVIKNSF